MSWKWQRTKVLVIGPIYQISCYLSYGILHNTPYITSSSLANRAGPNASEVRTLKDIGNKMCRERQPSASQNQKMRRQVTLYHNEYDWRMMPNKDVETEFSLNSLRPCYIWSPRTSGLQWPDNIMLADGTKYLSDSLSIYFPREHSPMQFAGNLLITHMTRPVPLGFFINIFPPLRWSWVVAN